MAEENLPHRNVGKEWSKVDVFELRFMLGRQTSAARIAEHLRRTEPEIQKKARELGLTRSALAKRSVGRPVPS